MKEMEMEVEMEQENPISDNIKHPTKNNWSLTEAAPQSGQQVTQRRRH